VKRLLTAFLAIPVLAATPVAAADDVAAAPPVAGVDDVAAAPPAAAEATEQSSPFDLGIDSDEPLEITSQELEVQNHEGKRQLIFSTEVVVEQGDLRIESNRLEAFYPQGSSQPERLVATGSVRLAQRTEQGERRARCDEAVYTSTPETLVCTGNAELEDGGDRLRGKTIEFDLEKETVKVRGGATLILAPKEGKAP